MVVVVLAVRGGEAASGHRLLALVVLGVSIV